jgi:hypothetical protein
MTLTSIRRWHSYLGLFMAPSVLFFAITGAAQLYNLHETHGTYRPAAVLEKLSSVHKDQVFKLGDHHEPPQPEAGAQTSDATTAPAAAEADEKADLSTLALKAFFLWVSLCLVLSTSLGLWMGLKQTRQKRTAWALVFAGAAIPVGLLLL